MGPIDYTGAMQPANPLAAFTQSLQLGAGVQQLEAQRAKQAEELALAQQQRAQAEAQQAALGQLAAMQNPTAADYARVSTLIPSLAENLGKTWKMLEPEQQAARLNLGYQAMAAAKSGNPEIAAEMLRKQANAAKNSGDTKGAEGYEGWAVALERDPEGASKSIGMMLSATDPKFAETYGKLSETWSKEAMAPVTLREAKAKATTAEAEAGVAGEKARLGVDVLKADMEWKRQDSRIKAMQASISKESNDLKRQELIGKMDEARTARDQKARDLQAEVDNTLTGVSDRLQIIRDIKKLGIGMFTGATAAAPFTDAREVTKKIAQLQSLLTLEQLQFLKGSSTDKDMQTVREGASTLDLYNPKATMAELSRIESILFRADAQARKKYNLPVGYYPPGVTPPPTPVTDTTRAVPIPGQAPRNIVVDW